MPEHFATIREAFHLQSQMLSSTPAEEGSLLHQPKILAPRGIVAQLKRVGADLNSQVVPTMPSAITDYLHFNRRVRIFPVAATKDMQRTVLPLVIVEYESDLLQVRPGTCILEGCALLFTTFFLLATMVGNFW